jgi:hypothetical protein
MALNTVRLNGPCPIQLLFIRVRLCHVVVGNAHLIDEYSEKSEDSEWERERPKHFVVDLRKAVNSIVVVSILHREVHGASESGRNQKGK